MLKFNSDGKFTILALGDVHHKTTYKTENKLKYEDTMALLNAALDEYKPDLCVFMGDNCSCRPLTEETPEGDAEYLDMVLAATEPVRKRNIPFAMIMGNHDHDLGHEEREVEICSSVEGCLMRNDAPPEVRGNANYNEIIYSSDGERPVFNLWFMDSNNCHSDINVSHYDWVHEDQIKWYEGKAAELKEMNGGKPLPALLFQHIPVYEEYNLLREAKWWERPVAVRGENLKKNTFYVKKDGVDGYLGEGPCSPDYNGGQFASWKKTGDIIGAVFGHDHMNDFAGETQGIVLMQCQTSGFNVYTNGCRSGVRVIVLDENKPETFETCMKHFKEFGLKSKSLGPIMRTLTDRQSIAMHTAFNIFCGVAGAAGVAAAGVLLYKFLK